MKVFTLVGHAALLAETIADKDHSDADYYSCYPEYDMQDYLTNVFFIILFFLNLFFFNDLIFVCLAQLLQIFRQILGEVYLS